MSEPIIRLEKMIVCGICGASEKLHENWHSGHTFDPVEKTFRVSYFEGHREEVTPMDQLRAELAEYIGSPMFLEGSRLYRHLTADQASAFLVATWLSENGYLSERIVKGGS